MRAINGHDYYDHASPWRDDTIFIREEELIENTPFDLDAYLPNLMLIFVAGLTYPVLKTNKYCFKHDSHNYIFDKDEAINYVNSIDCHKAFGWSNGFYVKRVRKHFSITKDAYEKWLIENMVVTGITEVKIIEQGRSNRRKVVLYKNISNLKDYEFFRKLDAWEAHNAISNYVGGVLATDPAIIQLGNNDKIKKAGFDTIQSFRHRK